MMSFRGHSFHALRTLVLYSPVLCFQSHPTTQCRFATLLQVRITAARQCAKRLNWVCRTLVRWRRVRWLLGYSSEESERDDESMHGALLSAIMVRRRRTTDGWLVQRSDRSSQTGLCLCHRFVSTFHNENGQTILNMIDDVPAQCACRVIEDGRLVTDKGWLRFQQYGRHIIPMGQEGSSLTGLLSKVVVNAWIAHSRAREQVRQNRRLPDQ